MLKCSKEAFAACPDRKGCSCPEEAVFTEGSECDMFNRQIGSHTMTHADQIRAMNDEELAKLIYGVDGLGWCKSLPECIKQIGLIPEEKCIGCALEWLKQPAEVSGDD